MTTPASAPTPVLIRGVPDDSRVQLTVDAAGNIGYAMPGTASFLTQLRTRMAPHAQLTLGPGFPVRIPGPRPGCLINYIADADQARLANDAAEALVDATGLPCFNHPAAVRATTRDALARLLADVPDIDMPRTVRIRARNPADLVAQALDAGIAFPLLVRVAGDHGGVSLARLDSAEALDPLHGIPWGGRELYVTEFREFADADGRYRKMRLVVVGKRVFIRHLAIGDQWLLHADRRGPDEIDEEQAFLAGFNANVLPRLRRALVAVMQRVHLDYYGIDCSLRPDGRLLVFELNACMNILHNSRPSPNMWDAPIAAISNALLALLATPGAWHHRPATPATQASATPAPSP